jgi:hypothetical protein
VRVAAATFQFFHVENVLLATSRALVSQQVVEAQECY